MDEPRPIPPRSPKAITGWVAASALAHLLQARIAGQGIFVADQYGWSMSDSPLHGALLDSLEGGNPLGLGAAPFLHTTFMHAFLAIVGLLFAGRLVERFRGGGVAFVVLGVGGVAGAAVGWAVDGAPALGATTPYFGLLGVAIVLAAKREVDGAMLWSVSFPLLALAGMFALFATEVPYVSNTSHLVALATGVVSGLLPPGSPPFRLPVRLGIGACLLAGAIVVVPAALGSEASHFGKAPEGGLMGMEARFDVYEDPEGRFRIEHPSVLEPVSEPLGEGGSGGTHFYFVTKREGAPGSFELRIRPLAEGRHRKDLVRDEIVELGRLLGRNGRGLGYSIEGSEVFDAGAARAIRTTVAPDGAPVEFVVVAAVTGEHEYVGSANYDTRETGPGALERGWVLRMIRSLEIRR